MDKPRAKSSDDSKKESAECQARAKSLEESIRDITECPICSETLHNNRSLPCLHTFCLKCLEKFTSRKNTRKFPCPICRKEFSIPKGGISKLPSNFLVDKVITAHKGGKEEIPPKGCDICSSDGNQIPATSYCCYCKQNLCSTCDTHHRKIKATATHKIVDINLAACQDEEAQSEPVYCDLHRRKEAELFCKECNTLICWQCKSMFHNSHNTVGMSEAAKDFRDKLQGKVDLISRRLSKQQSKLQLLTDTEKRCLEEIEAKKQNISKETDRLVQNIKEQGERLKAQQTKSASERATSLHLQRSKLESEMEALKNHRRRTENMRDNPNFYELLAKTGEFLAISEDSDKEDNPESVVPAARHLSQSVLQDILTGKTSIDQPQCSSGTENQLKSSEVVTRNDQQLATDQGKDILKYENTRLLKEICLSDGRGVLGVTVHDDKIYVVSQCTTEIRVYSASDYKYLNPLPVNDLQQPNDITSCEINNCLYICDWGTRHIVRVEIGLRNQQTQWRTDSELGCLSVTIDHNVLLAGFKTSKLIEYTTHGELIHTVELEHSIQPWHALKLSSGYFVVCYGSTPKSKHRVSSVDIGGRVLKSFGDDAGSDDKHLCGPYHLTVDDEGFILVVDCNNGRVVLLNSDLEFKRELISSSTKVLRRPRRIYLDKRTSRIYVTDNAVVDKNAKDGKILVFTCD